MKKMITVQLGTGGRSTIDGMLPVYSRLGIERIHVYASLAHPTDGVRRLSEIGDRIRDAGIAVETYFTRHVLGVNSPDSLSCEIDAAKALGARALCLNTPDDDEIETSRGKNGRIDAELRDLEALMLSDWKRARRDLRAAELAIRLQWITGIYRSSDKTLRKLLACGRGKDVGVSWHACNDPVSIKYDMLPLLRMIGHRISDFSTSFDERHQWFSHGYSSYGSYPQYTLEQKKEKCIEEFRDVWAPALDLLPAGVLACVEFRIGDKEGEDEDFLVRQLDALDEMLGESERRKRGKSRKCGRRAGK